MLEILTWLVAIGVAALGFISFQIGLTASKESQSNAQLVGVLVMLGCLIGAGFLAYLASEQASSISVNY